MSGTAPPEAPTPRRSGGRLLARYWPELLAGLAWLAALLALGTMTVWHDIAWQLWIARQLNAGIPLYDWIMEVNPPLWYWMAQPIDLLAAATGLPATHLLVWAVFLLIGVCLGLSAALAFPWPARQRAMLLAGILAGTIVVVLPDFAQREHLLLIGVIPYALMIARRIEGHLVSLGLAIAVALLATPMIALKHYFVLIPVLLELWLLRRRRRNWRPVRPETIILVLGALAYVGAILAFAPAYLTTMVPALSLAYGIRVSLFLLLVNQMNLLLAVCGFYFWYFRRELSPATLAILLVTVALTLSYYLQFKGWSYQMTPVVAGLLLAMTLHLAQRPSRPALRFSEALTAALILACALWPNISIGPYRNGFEPSAGQLLADTKPGMTAVMLTTKAANMWAMVDEHGLTWPSRYYNFWMMQTVADRLASGQPLDGPLLDLVSRVRLETVEDFLCNPPDILIDDAVSVDGVPFDMLGLFKQEPRFAELMTSYAEKSGDARFTVYERVADLPAPASVCQTIAPPH